MKAVRIAAILFLSAALVAGPAAAQHVVSLGIKGGINLATVSATVGGTELDPDSRRGAHGGFVVSYAFSRNFAIQGEGLYVGKGFEPNSQVMADLDVNYVDFPLLAMFTFPIGESILAPRVFLGPVFSWRVTCNLTVDPADTSGVTDCELDAAKVFDFGIEAGAGLKIGRGAGGLTLDVAYDYGLTNVSNAGGGDAIRNRNLMFSLGYLLPIK